MIHVLGDFFLSERQEINLNSIKGSMGATSLTPLEMGLDQLTASRWFALFTRCSTIRIVLEKSRISGIDHLHSYAKQPIWRTTSKFRRSPDRIIHVNSFVYKYFSSNRGINASGLLMLIKKWRNSVPPISILTNLRISKKIVTRISETFHNLKVLLARL